MTNLTFDSGPALHANITHVYQNDVYIGYVNYLPRDEGYMIGWWENTDERVHMTKLNVWDYETAVSALVRANGHGAIHD
jgi:hypothetical protein